MYILSVSHKIAPIEIREKLALSTEEQKRFMLESVGNEHITECVYLTTCNRTEVYFSGDDKALDEMENIFIHFAKVDYSIKKYFLVFIGENAIRHLYNVASGLDSMLIGEDEILGQLKDAFNFALELGGTKYYLNTLFRGSITCAKNIKTNTNVSKIPISLATLVTNMIMDIKKDNLNVLIIGITGKFGSAILKNLYNKDNINIVGTTRNHNSSFEYKNKYNLVEMINYTERYNYIDKADIIISVTKSPHYTIVANEVIKKVTTKKTRLFIDLSVPKDIDINIEEIDDFELYNIDYFKEISEVNNMSKIKEVEVANSIISKYIDDVLKELHFHDFLPEINNVKNVFLNNNFESIIYKIRDNSTSDELKTMVNIFKKLY